MIAAVLERVAGIDVCPGNNESGGKRKSGRTTKGNPYLRDVLLEVAWASTRTKNSGMQRRYRRLSPRKGHKRAIVAVAHALLRAVYWCSAAVKPGSISRPPPQSEPAPKT